jgi:hypothetical protein
MHSSEVSASTPTDRLFGLLFRTPSGNEFGSWLPGPDQSYDLGIGPRGYPRGYWVPDILGLPLYLTSNPNDGKLRQPTARARDQW